MYMKDMEKGKQKKAATLRATILPLLAKPLKGIFKNPTIPPSYHPTIPKPIGAWSNPFCELGKCIEFIFFRILTCSIESGKLTVALT